MIINPNIHRTKLKLFLIEFEFEKIVDYSHRDNEMLINSIHINSTKQFHFNFIKAICIYFLIIANFGR